MQKQFDLPFGKLEQQALTFRCEAFNVLNHPNLFTPLYVGGLDSSEICSLASFYLNTAATIAGGRTMKFWLMYSF